MWYENEINIIDDSEGFEALYIQMLSLMTRWWYQFGRRWRLRLKLMIYDTIIEEHKYLMHNRYKIDGTLFFFFFFWILFGFLPSRNLRLNALFVSFQLHILFDSHTIINISNKECRKVIGLGAILNIVERVSKEWLTYLLFTCIVRTYKNYLTYLFTSSVYLLFKHSNALKSENTKYKILIYLIVLQRRIFGFSSDWFYILVWEVETIYKDKDSVINEKGEKKKRKKKISLSFSPPCTFPSLLILLLSFFTSFASPQWVSHMRQGDGNKYVHKLRKKSDCCTCMHLMHESTSPNNTSLTIV